MKISSFISSLFLTYETFFCMVLGQAINNEKTDCTKLMNFIEGNSNDYSNNCCTIGGIKYNNEGYITSFSNELMEGKITDLKSFPFLSKLEELIIVETFIQGFPGNIFTLSSLKKLELANNYFEEIPTSIKNLSNLEHLNLESDSITKLPNEIFSLTNLKFLGLGINNIEEIPSSIQNLSKLENLVLKSNEIKKLPDEIYNLKNLKKLDLSNNKTLDTKILRFGNSVIQECNFNSLNIICYDLHTCESISYNNRKFSDAEAEKYLKICPRDDNNLNQDDNDNKKSNYTFIIVGTIVVIFIGVIVAFILIKKKKSQKDNDLDINYDDEFRAGSIKVNVLTKMKGNSINNNGIGIGGINSINNTSKNNSNHSNLNPNNMVNSSHITDNYNLNSNIGPLDNNEMNLYYSSVDEGNESLPEYTEIINQS